MNELTRMYRRWRCRYQHRTIRSAVVRSGNDHIVFWRCADCGATWELTLRDMYKAGSDE